MRILPLVTRIMRFTQSDLTPYIHCSKINSVLQIFKAIPPILERLRSQPLHFTMKHYNAVTSIHSIIDQFDDLFRSCRRETCLRFVLSTPVSEPKTEISMLRNSMADAFTTLDCLQIAQMFRITDGEMQNQDTVDMKRIVQVLIQISLKKREDATASLKARFESLQRLGMDVSQDDAENVTIPELPTDLRLVVRHSDVNLENEIGNGQAGIVKKGTMVETGEVVAVKILYRKVLSKPEQESFRREVIAMSVLNHPTLLKFKGYTEEAPFYVITEFMPNGSLFEMLRKNPDALTPTIRTLIALDVARGLEYLHGKGMIHRDLKSLNILLDENYRAKICDFGMARIKSEGPKTGLIGTAHWMAPEVLLSAPDYDQKVDVYSYGIFLWELLTGDMPYKDMKQSQITVGVTMENMRPPLPENGPSRIIELIQSCWHNSPSERPTMSRVVAMLALPKYHFPGTDEAVFQSRSGIGGRHKLTGSHFEQRRHIPNTREKSSGSIARTQNPKTLILEIEQSSGYLRAGYARMLSQMLVNEDTAVRLVGVGGCRTLAELLTEQSEASDHVLKGLCACRYGAVFDVDVLKALLLYSGAIDETRRMNALRALLVGTELRFEFICSAPSFVVQLVQFLRKQIDDKNASDLLMATNKVVRSFHHLPDGIVTVLIEFWSLKPQLRDLTRECLFACFNFKQAQNEVSLEQFEILFSEPMVAKDVIESYCRGNEPCAFDRTFITALYAQRRDHFYFGLLANIAKNPRFMPILVSLLPTGEDTRIAATLYPPLLENPVFYPALVEIPEFYAVASYFVASGRVEMICGVLKKCNVKPFILQSRLCSLLAQTLHSTSDDNQRISIMAAVFSISNVILAPEFAQLLPLLFGFLLSENRQLRIPSFLCISALSAHNVDGINYPKLVQIAAYYANADSSLVRVTAGRVLQEHLRDEGVNQNNCLQIFIESADNNSGIAVAIDAFKSFDREHPLDPGLMLALSKLAVVR